MRRMTGTPCWQAIPMKLSLEQFEQFVLPHLSRGRRGPPPSLSSHKIFNYSRTNRKAIFNRGTIPNIPENSRGRKKPKRGRKQRFNPAIFEERFRTIERVFAWEDRFRRLLLRFEHLSQVHYAFKTLVYTMINLRHYC
jgi:hypothetical protein